MQSPQPSSHMSIPKSLLHLVPGGLILAGWIYTLIPSGSLLFKTVLASNGEISQRIWLIPMVSILWLIFFWSVVRLISMNPSAEKYILIAILILGASIRIGWIVAFPTTPASDFQVNHDIAVELSHGETRDSYPRPIGYAAILSLAYRVYPDAASGRWLNVLFSIGTIYAIYRIAKLEVSPLAGLLSAGFMAFSFTEIPMVSILGTEVGSLMLLLVGLYFVLFSVRYPERLVPPVLAGAFIGMAVLYRQAMLFFLPVFLMAYGPGVPNHKRWKPLLRFLVGISVAILGLGLWFSLLSGQLSLAPYTANVGTTTILTGTNFEAKGIFNFEDAELYSSWSAEEKDRRAVEEAVRRIQADPRKFVFELIPAKMARFLSEKTYGIDWSLYPIDRNWSPLELEYIQFWMKVIAQTGYMIGLLAGTIYAASTIRVRDRFWWVLVGLIIMSVAPYILLEATPRYHHPFLGCLALAGGIGITRGMSILHPGARTKSG